MSDCKRLALLVGFAALVAGCGQTGKLYLPEPAGEVVTRPTQTPPETSAPSNTPQTVDSPPHADTPAPEVTEPERQREKEKTVDKKNPQKD